MLPVQRAPALLPLSTHAAAAANASASPVGWPALAAAARLPAAGVRRAWTGAGARAGAVNVVCGYGQPGTHPPRSLPPPHRFFSTLFDNRTLRKRVPVVAAVASRSPSNSNFTTPLPSPRHCRAFFGGAAAKAKEASSSPQRDPKSEDVVSEEDEEEVEVPKPSKFAERAPRCSVSSY